MNFKTYMEQQSIDKTLMILVGPPSIGKSTWIETNAPEAYVINRDDIVTRVAGEFGMTYDDLFVSPNQELPEGHVDQNYGEVIARPEYLPSFLPDKVWSNVTHANGQVAEELAADFPAAIKSGQDIVIDMTNMSVGARKAQLDNFSSVLDEYKKVAVVFNFEGSDVQQALKKIAGSRAEEIRASGGSKTIPDTAFDRMFASYEPPSASEGFDEVISVDDRERILQAL